MREKNNSLKLRKFKVASLQATWLKGGTNSQPYHNTQQSGPPTETCQTNCETCTVICGTDPTRTKAMTQPGSPCTQTCDANGNGINPTNNGSQNTGPNCP